MGITKFIEKVCVESAILWSGKVGDGFGNFTYLSCKEIKVRWQDVTTLSIPKIGFKDGKILISEAYVLVQEDIPESSMIMKGVLVDLMSAYESDDLPENVLDPYDLGAFEVKKFEKIPMIKSKTVFIRKIYLSPK